MKPVPALLCGLLVLDGTAGMRADTGSPTLVTDRGEVQLHPGMCAGFPAGGSAHQIVNRSSAEAVYLEIGDRTPGDGVEYPVDDLQAKLGPDGNWVFGPKDRG